MLTDFTVAGTQALQSDFDFDYPFGQKNDDKSLESVHLLGKSEGAKGYLQPYDGYIGEYKDAIFHAIGVFPIEPHRNAQYKLACSSRHSYGK